MVVHHIVLFKLKPETTKEQVSELEATVKDMVGKIPGTICPMTDYSIYSRSDCHQGLVKIEFGPPLESTAARAKGYNAGLIAVLEKPDDVKVYAEHPVHQKLDSPLPVPWSPK
ncbi:uncharacterized protein LTR77_002195 [Saxophila tyrrhenica]|uniref:Stress-response A/B barrel domain-containing protein n=1 Tax=Saxophila tyrrhenica TaxID=1690608 RepID=A0AAV9PIU0_9PEZI|nr:hypothetical protein LTR77_002195 [Saxophila tyrrhenica]